MTEASRSGTVRLVADLEVEVDGRLATVRADGTHVRVRAEDPVPLLRDLQLAVRRSGAGRGGPARALGRVADDLAAAGLTATLEGSRGPVLHLGDPGSRLGRWVTGSAAVRPGPVSGWRAVLGSALAPAVRPGPTRRGATAATAVTVAVAAMAVMAVVAVVLRRRRR